MYLPVQREPVQRLIVGLRSDDPNCASGAAESSAAEGRGIEPSFFDDFISMIKPPRIWEEGGIIGPRL